MLIVDQCNVSNMTISVALKVEYVFLFLFFPILNVEPTLTQNAADWQFLDVNVPSAAQGHMRKPTGITEEMFVSMEIDEKVSLVPCDHFLSENFILHEIPKKICIFTTPDMNIYIFKNTRIFVYLRTLCAEPKVLNKTKSLFCFLIFLL